jgi:hypothetical protein
MTQPTTGGVRHHGGEGESGGGGGLTDAAGRTTKAGRTMKAAQASSTAARPAFVEDQGTAWSAKELRARDSSSFYGGATTARELWLAGSCEATTLARGPWRGGRCRRRGERGGKAAMVRSGQLGPAGGGGQPRELGWARLKC